MGPVPKGGLIAVTGAAGFIGGWVVRYLLDDGYRVRACVRDADDDRKCAFLKAMPAYSSGRLTLHSADLDEDQAFNEIFKGCRGVAHISHVTDYTDQEYVRRVCESVIRSVNQSETVTRVVVTSSIAAIMSETNIDAYRQRPIFHEGRFPKEDDPKRTETRQGYSMGKVLAERLFTNAASADGGWDTLICCPGDNVGPIQSAHQQESAWQGEIKTMLEGAYNQSQAYRPWMPVDVRDVARVHVALLQSKQLNNGDRVIAASGEQRNVEDVCASIPRLLPELNFQPPAAPIDQHSPKTKAREAEWRAVWAQTELRNDLSRDLFGIEYVSMDVSTRDCVESLISIAGIVPAGAR